MNSYRHMYMTNIYKEYNPRKAFIYMNEMFYFEGMDGGIDITLGTDDGNQMKGTVVVLSRDIVLTNK